MTDEAERKELKERLETASSIEWGLQEHPHVNYDSGGDGLSKDVCLQGNAAKKALDEMSRIYDGLSEWVEAVRLAAKAEAAADLARRLGVPRVVTNGLIEQASKAKLALQQTKMPNADDPQLVLRRFAQLQRLAGGETLPAE